jgi:hypothetical protein
MKYIQYPRRDTAMPCPYLYYVPHIPEKCCIDRLLLPNRYKLRYKL